MNIKFDWQPAKQTTMTLLVIIIGTVPLLLAIVGALGYVLRWDRDAIATAVAFIGAVGAYCTWLLRLLQNGAVAEAQRVIEQAYLTPSPVQQEGIVQVPPLVIRQVTENTMSASTADTQPQGRISVPEPLQSVYSRSECPFHYCDNPSICQTADRCHHVVPEVQP